MPYIFNLATHPFVDFMDFISGGGGGGGGVATSKNPGKLGRCHIIPVSH